MDYDPKLLKFGVGGKTSRYKMIRLFQITSSPQEDILKLSSQKSKANKKILKQQQNPNLLHIRESS